MTRAYGATMVGLWMSEPHEAHVMQLAMEERLRNIGADDPDRPLIEKWRTEAMNLQSRAQKEQWIGWENPDA